VKRKRVDRRRTNPASVSVKPADGIHAALDGAMAQFEASMRSLAESIARAVIRRELENLAVPIAPPRGAASSANAMRAGPAATSQTSFLGALSVAERANPASPPRTRRQRTTPSADEAPAAVQADRAPEPASSPEFPESPETTDEAAEPSAQLSLLLPPTSRAETPHRPGRRSRR
jgi:hypothetical protein